MRASRAALSAALLLAASVFAQDARSGAVKARACHACHGVDGIATLPDAPHLASQPAIYTERALRAYRSGERRHEVMNVVAKLLTDTDIRDLAAHYAEMTIEVKATQR